MKTAALSLDYFFLVRSHLVATPLDGETGEGVPIIHFAAELISTSLLACTAIVQWGEERKTPYFIAAELRSQFSIKKKALRNPPIRENYLDLALNAAQITYSALRSHVAAITAMGPHHTRYLPTMIIDPSDVKIFVGDEMNSVMRSEKKAPRHIKEGVRKAEKQSKS